MLYVTAQSCTLLDTLSPTSSQIQPPSPFFMRSLQRLPEFIPPPKLQKVERGSFVLVRAGETVPLDGVVVMGKSTCTLEHLTGESTPVVKKKGESVPGGAQNLEGLLIVKVGAKSAFSYQLFAGNQNWRQTLPWDWERRSDD